MDINNLNNDFLKQIKNWLFQVLKESIQSSKKNKYFPKIADK